ncbi:MAG: mevalonate kinase [Deltaproteobacteria bacterium]|nr:mevalonate kinase [Deltaproteobacteria bacterium]
MTSTKGPTVGHSGGKVILLGEHAVVHGSYAVAMGIRPGVRVSARREGEDLVLSIPRWESSFAANDGSREGEAIRQLVCALGLEPEGMLLEAEFEIPARAGLGSSAALACAAARAIVSLTDIEMDKIGLFNAIQASERVFHGNPSGLDARVALDEGVVLFSRSEGARPITAQPPPLHVFHSGEQGDTYTTVARFAKRLKETGDEGASRLLRISLLVDRGVDALARGDFEALGEVMNENQDQLAWFGMSTPNLNKIVRTALEAGALGAKLTGGGGGGCAVVLTRSDDTTVARRVAAAGFEQVEL